MEEHVSTLKSANGLFAFPPTVARNSSTILHQFDTNVHTHASQRNE